MSKCFKSTFICLLTGLLAFSGCGSDAKPTPPKEVKVFPSKYGSEMVLITGGEFTMGSTNGEEDEAPTRKVKVGSFLMDRYETTQKSFEELTGKNPSKFKGKTLPVEQVSWYSAAIDYCNMRSTREGLKPCYDTKTMKCDFSASGYRLPTEAEWEYACRAGSDSDYFFGSSESKLDDYAWTKKNSGGKSHAVGGKKPNAYGLYDIHGNVKEYCNDFYGDESYVGAGTDNPKGPEETDECSLRGGGWNTSPENCRSASRFSETPRFADACFGSDEYGIRCVRKVPAEK